ncbi:unnamed protein product, partial [Timema podura]|nr:unnamed protein product [Timema podura]
MMVDIDMPDNMIMLQEEETDKECDQINEWANMTGFLSALGGVCLQRKSPSRPGLGLGLCPTLVSTLDMRKCNVLTNSSQDVQYCPVTHQWLLDDLDKDLNISLDEDDSKNSDVEKPANSEHDSISEVSGDDIGQDQPESSGPHYAGRDNATLWNVHPPPPSRCWRQRNMLIHPPGVKRTAQHAETVYESCCPFLQIMFVGQLLRLLVCNNEKFGAQIQKHVKELVGHEMSPALYPILFDQIKAIVDKFFDQQGQVIVSDINTQFIEHTIFIMKNVLDTKTDHPAEHLGVTSIEGMMLAIVRYVRHLDMTVHAIHIKTKLCQLVEGMMKRRDDLAFRQEMKFRNKLVEYLTDWVMGTSHQIAPPGSGDVTVITRDLDQACMEAVAALLRGLPLQPEESDRGDLMEAKSQLFLNISLCICDDDGAMLTDLGYNRDLQTRAAFMEVLTKILQQGTEFDTLAETVLADRFEQLVQLVTMISDKGELPIAMALANVVTTSQMDELARVFVTLFDAKHLLSPLLWNMFYREVEVSDCMQTLFRGNSLGSKIMAFCFKIYGASYLQTLLEPLIRPLLEETNQSFEVDPARVDPSEDIEENRRNLIALTQKVFDAIVSSADK